jgi:hypothetical protein
LRILLREARGDGGDVVAGARDSDTVFYTADGEELMHAARARVARRLDELRHPDVHRLWIIRCLGRDTDDGVRSLIQRDLPPENVGSAGEARLPQPVRDDDDIARAGCPFARCEEASLDRREPEHGKEVRADDEAVEARWIAAVRREVRRAGRELRHGGKARRLIAIVDEVRG